MMSHPYRTAADRGEESEVEETAPAILYDTLQRLLKLDEIEDAHKVIRGLAAFYGFATAPEQDNGSVGYNGDGDGDE